MFNLPIGQAIRKAQDDVSGLMPHGPKQYVFQTYDHVRKGWRISHPNTYAATRSHRTRVLIGTALCYAGWDEIDAMCAEDKFTGSSDWRTYVRESVK
jgi:hypothetical protein